jgi:hypothetical protein
MEDGLILLHTKPAHAALGSTLHAPSKTIANRKTIQRKTE